MAGSTDDPTHSPPRAEEVDESAATSVAQEEVEDDAGVVVTAPGTPQPNDATLVVAPPGTPQPDMLLWNSVETLANHPILYHAVMQVKRKIEAGTLSTSYRIVDHPNTDHKAILLALRGSFKVEDFTTLDGVNIHTYAYADSLGIGFNLHLVQASTRHFERHPSLEAALNTLDGMSYSAVLQESLEHELGHLKNHAELMNGCWTIETPQGPPLHAEAGFMTNRQIRLDNDNGARILEVPPPVQARGYGAPLGLIWGAFRFEGGAVKVHQYPDLVVTHRELIQHMQYGGLPVLAESLAGEEAAAEDQPSGSRKRPREDEDVSAAGGCGNRRGRNSPGGLHPVVSRAAGMVPTSLALEPAETEQVAGKNEKQMAGKKEKQMAGMNKEEQKAGANEEELHQDYLALVDAGKQQLISETMPKTTVDAQFCDRDGRPRDSFAPSEEVYVLLTFTNPTSEDAYVMLYHGNFGRGAFSLRLEGEEGRYTPTARHQFVVKKLLPGASHTFAPRKFCGGRPDPGTRTKGFDAVPHWTPQNAGTYYATVWGWNVRFPLVIQQEDASNA